LGNSGRVAKDGHPGGPQAKGRKISGCPPPSVRPDLSVAAHHGGFDFGRVEERGRREPTGSRTFHRHVMPPGSLFPSSCCCCAEMLVHVEPNRCKLFRAAAPPCDGGMPPAVRLASRAIRHCPIRFSPVSTGRQSENLMSTVGATGSEPAAWRRRGGRKVIVAPQGCDDCRRSTARSSRPWCVRTAGSECSRAENTGRSQSWRLRNGSAARISAVSCASPCWPLMSSSGSWMGGRLQGWRMS
jgi:hypothetical protein